LSVPRARNESEKLAKAKQVTQMLLGDPNNGVEPMGITQIQKAMDFKKNDSVYFYKKIAIENGLLSVDETGKAILPKKSVEEKWRIYSKNHKLVTDPLISRYLDKESSKNGGKGVQVTRINFNILERFFNTVRITPKQLVQDKSNEIVEYWRDEYLKAYRNQTDWQKIKKERGDIQTLTLRLNYALASFCSGHGITWTRGDPKMSRKIVGHAKYADIRFTNEEYPKLEKYLLDRYGLDSDFYRWVWVGIETCCRSGVAGEGSGLYGIKLQWDVINSVTKSGEKRTTFVMKAFESKTQNVKDGIWTKWIKRTQTQESLIAIKNRGSSRIYQTDLPKQEFLLNMNIELKKLYEFLGKDPDSLFFKKPTHSLRHVGAHYWLAKGNYKNHVEVAKLGGWNTIDEMIKSYGEFPPEKMNEYLDEYDYN